MKNIFLAATGTALLAFAGGTFAAALSPASTQDVTLTVGSACTVQAPAAAAFTPIINNSATGAAQDIVANAVVTCTNTQATLGIDSGTNGTTTQRRMKGPGVPFINYTVKDSTANPIGTTGLTTYAGALPFTAPSIVVTPSATPTAVPITVSLPAGTTPTVAGAYTDTLSYYVEF